MIEVIKRTPVDQGLPVLSNGQTEQKTADLRRRLTACLDDRNVSSQLIAEAIEVLPAGDELLQRTAQTYPDLFKAVARIPQLEQELDAATQMPVSTETTLNQAEIDLVVEALELLPEGHFLLERTRHLYSWSYRAALIRAIPASLARGLIHQLTLIDAIPLLDIAHPLLARAREACPTAFREAQTRFLESRLNTKDPSVLSVVELLRRNPTSQKLKVISETNPELYQAAELELEREYQTSTATEKTDKKSQSLAALEQQLGLMIFLGEIPPITLIAEIASRNPRKETLDLIYRRCGPDGQALLETLKAQPPDEPAITSAAGSSTTAQNVFDQTYVAYPGTVPLMPHESRTVIFTERGDLSAKQIERILRGEANSYFRLADSGEIIATIIRAIISLSNDLAGLTPLRLDPELTDCPESIKEKRRYANGDVDYEPNPKKIQSAFGNDDRLIELDNATTKTEPRHHRIRLSLSYTPMRFNSLIFILKPRLVAPLDFFSRTDPRNLVYMTPILELLPTQSTNTEDVFTSTSLEKILYRQLALKIANDPRNGIWGKCIELDWAKKPIQTPELASSAA